MRIGDQSDIGISVTLEGAMEQSIPSARIVYLPGMTTASEGEYSSEASRSPRTTIQGSVVSRRAESHL